MQLKRKESLEKSLKLVVPSGAKFMKIGMILCLTNIKMVFTITKE